MEKIIVELKENNIVKEGEFILKSGKKSNIYFDFKSLPNYPHLMNNISILFKEYLESNELTDKVICGVPYGGIPFASILSLNLNLPLMILRKEAKNYGTKKKLEGNLYYDKKVILVEDVITTGSSVIETIEYFKSLGLEVSHVITVLTRNEFSNKKYFLDNNIKYFSCLFQSDFTRNILDKISYSELPRLYDIVNLKKNKLMVSLDISDPELFLLALDTISENLVMLKTHIDIMDFSNYDKNEFIDKLSIKKFENNFEILEDYKFRDIAEISYRQLISQGIDKYADYITCHGITGDGFIRKLRDVDSKIKIILISQMSSKNNLITEEYHNEIVQNNIMII